ncbi:hypothetical protein DL770_011681 [Monosporascus sp. CRB-9-2]|nr:hypothetical protein DL770_011681 [Monosporascus sp. CRB-9-2]
MLYVADLLLDDPDLRFGYADDLCLLRASKSFDENVSLLADDIRRILKWGHTNKVAFDPAKSELQHFTRARHDHAPNVEVPEESFIIRQVRGKDGKITALRWLGVWFDRYLNFKQHVKKLAG